MLGGGKGEGGGDAEEDLNGGICGLVRSKGWRCKKIGKLGIGGLDRFFDEVREREREREIYINKSTKPHHNSTFSSPPTPFKYNPQTYSHRKTIPYPYYPAITI